MKIHKTIYLSSFFALGLLAISVYLVISYPGAGLSGIRCMSPLRDNADYTATDLDGHSFDAQTLFAKPTLLFFGFTYCPEVCPTTLADISRWLDQLGKDSDKLQVLFVTIDPERDTPPQLKNYLSSFDKRIKGLILAPCDLAVMTKQYNVPYVKVDLGKDDYTFDHGASIFLLRPGGQMVETLNYEEGDDIAVKKLRLLLNRSKIDRTN